MPASVQTMAPSPRHHGVLRISGFQPDSTANEREGSSSSSTGPSHDSPFSVRPSSFSIHYTNIRGLSSNLSSVEHHLSSNSPNILLLSETQLSNDVLTSPFFISNYNLHSRVRFKGGVCAYSNINTPVARLKDLESPNFDVMWLKVCLPTTTLVLCFAYCSPNSTNFVSFFDYLNSCHETVTSSHPQAEILYLGDFNVHHREWLNSSHTDSGGIEALTFSILNDLEQIISQPTHIPDRYDHSANILDLFFTSNPSRCKCTISPPIGSSDHTLINVSILTAPPPPAAPSKRKYWHLNKADWNNLRNFFSDFPWVNYCLLCGDASVSAKRITEVILAGMEAFIPFSSKTTSSSNPWFNRSCSEAIQARDQAYRAWKTFPTSGSHSAFISARNRCKRVIREAKHSFIQRKCDNLSSSSTDRSFWSLAKGISNNFCRSTFPSLFRPDGTIAVSPIDKASLFGSRFSSNSTLDDSNIPSPPDAPLTNPMTLPVISFRTVRKALLSLDTSKAYGPDGIHPRVLKECASELAPVLARLFRFCLKTKTFPSSWKHALIHPIPKKGDRSDPSNYRPVALTSTISKVFESLLNSHILKHLENHSLLSDHQYGFRKARSTGDILSYLTNVWSSSLKDFGESYVVALDISKAFDRVWHRGLISKLPSFGFPPSLCSLISSFLSGRSISVVVDGSASPLFSINSGVPQGSVLSPTLFLLFFNEFLSSTSNPMHSYADDSTLHSSTSFSSAPSSLTRSASRLDTASTINSDLDRISQWGTQNLVKFNSSKTQFLPISLSRTPHNSRISFDGSVIPPLDSMNLLGITVTSNLSWKPHIMGIAKAASKKLGVLFRCRTFFSSEQLLRLYKGLIRPCMEYCSHIWGGSSSVSLLDRVESKAIRLINCPRLTSKLDPLALRRNVGSLSLFYRYYFGFCSRELAACVPPPLARPRNTRQAAASHDYCVAIGNSRVCRFDNCFFPYTSKLWNSLPSHVFPNNYDLAHFKKHVFHFLKNL